MPADPARQPPGPDQTAYRAAVQQAAAGGSVVMGKLIAAAREALQTREAATRDLRERDAFIESANKLRQFEPQLCKAYPEALLKAFAMPHGSKKSTALSVAEVQFDQLELMDDTQVVTSVALARIQQVVSLAVESSLSDLNTLVSSVLGVGRVQADANALRPESYVNALKEVVESTRVPATMQMQWFSGMGTTLGQELRALYTALSAQLRKQGVVSVTYAMPSGRAASGGYIGNANQTPSAPAGSGEPPQFQSQPLSQPQAQFPTLPPPQPQAQPARARSKDEVFLTLDKLRRLLAGELAPAQQDNRVEQFAAKFDKQFEDEARSPEGPASDFDSTVPAALEALTEMKQVERVVKTLEQRRKAVSDDGAGENTVEGQRQALRRGARDIAQALSLEVVTLMVDNMVNDTRLLEPVRASIRNLEPALLRLALVDPRFFTDRQHPARRLLQELTHHSMAYESVASPGFDAFLKGLQAALAPLFKASIESADIFEEQLHTLQQDWGDSTRAMDKDHLAAVEVLKHAEARNLLAEKVAQDIEALPDSAKVPAVVMNFLCGPWSQVVAQARITHGAGSAAAEKFEALIPALLWSAHPELARASPAKLTRLVPRLLPPLREGLDSIHYPAAKIDVFLEALMGIHQQAFRPSLAATQPATTEPRPEVASERVRLLEDGNPWIAPQEAASTNFVELQEAPVAPVQVDAPLAPDLDIVPEPATATDGAMPLGSWVELWSNDQWVRTQLTWASPHGTLFLFTGVFGTTQSMSRRLRDKLVQTGKLRMVSGQPFVDGALDAVAQTAMRNSVDDTE